MSAPNSDTSSLPSEMLAAQIVEFGQPLSINKIPLPSLTELKPHDLFLKVAAAGLCHSDLEYLKGTFPNITRPITGSHEGTGVVLAKGGAVDYFKIGDRVLAGQVRRESLQLLLTNSSRDFQQMSDLREVSRAGAISSLLSET